MQYGGGAIAYKSDGSLVSTERQAIVRLVLQNISVLTAVAMPLLLYAFRTHN
jgi:hypothetical protein